MTDLLETLIAEEWLMDVLTGDATLHSLVADRIYGYVAPKDAAYPFVIFKLEPGPNTHDVLGNSAVRIMSKLEYTVVAYGKTNSFLTLAPIAVRLDTLLHRASGEVTGGRVLSCVRLAPVQDIELDEMSPQVYRILGGSYQIQAQKA